MQPSMADSQQDNTDTIDLPPDNAIHDKTQSSNTSLQNEEEWPTHGGYLGCLMGIMFGCLAAAFIASPLVRGAVHAASDIGFQLNASALVIMLLGIIAFGYIGWKIGKRAFRDYTLPGPKPPPTQL